MNNIQEILPYIKKQMIKEEVIKLNPLILAFLGDALHNLYVKTELVFYNKSKVNFLQKEVAKKVNAKSQSKYMTEILNILNQDEINIFKRARNTKIKTMAKNSTIYDYRMSTCFESVVGYNYLIGNHERIAYLFKKIEEINI